MFTKGVIYCLPDKLLSWHRNPPPGRQTVPSYDAEDADQLIRFQRAPLGHQALMLPRDTSILFYFIFFIFMRTPSVGEGANPRLKNRTVTMDTLCHAMIPMLSLAEK